MKDRIKEFARILNVLNPFTTTVVKPWPGTEIEFEDLRMLHNVVIHFDEEGQLIIPTGGSAKVTFKNRGGKFSLKIDDYKERTAHTPGAKITGDLKFNLDAEDSQQVIPGYGTFSYKNE